MLHSASGINNALQRKHCSVGGCRRCRPKRMPPWARHWIRSGASLSALHKASSSDMVTRSVISATVPNHYHHHHHQRSSSSSLSISVLGIVIIQRIVSRWHELQPSLLLPLLLLLLAVNRIYRGTLFASDKDILATGTRIRTQFFSEQEPNKNEFLKIKLCKYSQNENRATFCTWVPQSS